jgi:hypothetical protein
MERDLFDNNFVGWAERIVVLWWRSAFIVHLRAFTQGEGSISDCQEKLNFYTIFRCLAG